MKWQYSHNAKKAIYLPTGSIFNIEILPQSGLEVTLATESPKLHEPQLSKLIPELKVVVTVERLKFQMRHLLQVYFCGDYTAAAYLLKELTGTNVSERTLQSWVMQTGKNSSRKCPEWAVSALEAYIEKNPTMSDTFQVRREKKIKNEIEQGVDALERARNSEGLERIERELESDERFRARMNSASLGDLPNIFSDSLLKQEKDISMTRTLLFHIYHEIIKATTLDDLKLEINKKFDDVINYSNFIYQGKRQLANEENEFSNEYGLLKDTV